MAVDPYEIQFYRGDYYPKVMTFTNKKTREAIDLSGADVILTVNREKNPTDLTNQLFQITGVVTDATAGKVTFNPAAEDNDLDPGKYYYDVSAITGTESKRTLVKSTWVIVMDIGKD